MVIEIHLKKLYTCNCSEISIAKFQALFNYSISESSIIATCTGMCIVIDIPAGVGLVSWRDLVGCGGSKGEALWEAWQSGRGQRFISSTSGR